MSRAPVAGWTRYPAEAATSEGIFHGLTLCVGVLLAGGAIGGCTRHLWPALIGGLLILAANLLHRRHTRATSAAASGHPQYPFYNRGSWAGTIMGAGIGWALIGLSPTASAFAIVAGGLLFQRAFLIAERQRHLHDHPLPERQPGW